METKLIVDSGTTKTRWVFLKNGEKTLDITTAGFNPYYITKNKAGFFFREIVPAPLNGLSPGFIYFYGTGCSSGENCSLVRSLFYNSFPESDITVCHDLTGTAVALFGKGKGVACILGTGSNSCVWDGKTVTENVPSLGWMLGDEGSGTYLGKLILAEVLSGKADKELQYLFYRYTKMDFTEVLHKLYNSGEANRWIASLSRFAEEYKDNREIARLIRKNFEDFYREQIGRYDNIHNLDIGFIGSVAYHFQDILKEVMLQYGLHVSKILKEPMEGLIAYHKNN